MDKLIDFWYMETYMSFKPKISVIIPVYNTAEYLEKCINCIILQTLSDIEVICINDGSTDNSLDILNTYAKKDKRIIIINQENAGQSVARNIGLDIAQGQYVYFVDSDDTIHEQTLEIMYRVAEKTGCSIVATEDINQLSKIKENTQKYQLTEIKYNLHNNPLKHLLNNIWSSSVIWNKLYKREVLKGWRFIEGIYFEDWPFVTCLFSTIDKYATIPYSLYFYNDENVSTVRSTFTTKKLNDYVTGIRFTYQYFQAKDKRKYAKDVREKRISASIKMMINKVKREPVNHKALVAQLKNNLIQLRKEGVWCYSDLPFKVILRFFKMCMRGY